MQLNILVLQQNLKSIEPDVNVFLSKSVAFFDAFVSGAAACVALARVKDGRWTEEEIKVLVELCYSEALASSSRDVAEKARRAMQADMLAVTESMWSG